MLKVAFRLPSRKPAAVAPRRQACILATSQDRGLETSQANVRFPWPPPGYRDMLSAAHKWIERVCPRQQARRPPNTHGLTCSQRRSSLIRVISTRLWVFRSCRSARLGCRPRHLRCLLCQLVTWPLLPHGTTHLVGCIFLRLLHLQGLGHETASQDCAPRLACTMTTSASIRPRGQEPSRARTTGLVEVESQAGLPNCQSRHRYDSALPRCKLVLRASSALAAVRSSRKRAEGEG